MPANKVIHAKITARMWILRYLENQDRAGALDIVAETGLTRHVVYRSLEDMDDAGVINSEKIGGTRWYWITARGQCLVDEMRDCCVRFLRLTEVEDGLWRENV